MFGVLAFLDDPSHMWDGYAPVDSMVCSMIVSVFVRSLLSVSFVFCCWSSLDFWLLTLLCFKKTFKKKKKKKENKKEKQRMCVMCNVLYFSIFLRYCNFFFKSFKFFLIKQYMYLNCLLIMWHVLYCVVWSKVYKIAPSLVCFCTGSIWKHYFENAFSWNAFQHHEFSGYILI